MSQAPAPFFSSADFTTAYLSLLPRGKVWPRETDAIIAQTIACFSPTYQRQVQSLAALLADAFPSNPVELLFEWEETLGLPNPFAGTQTIAQRQAQVLQKFANSGGQSVAYFLSVIGSLGFAGATITQFAPFRAGISHAGDPDYDQSWSFAWLITAPNLSVSYFSAGSATNTALYEIIGADELEYLIGQYAPAHTIPLFAVA